MAKGRALWMRWQNCVASEAYVFLALADPFPLNSQNDLSALPQNRAHVTGVEFCF